MFGATLSWLLPTSSMMAIVLLVPSLTDSILRGERLMTTAVFETITVLMSIELGTRRSLQLRRPRNAG